MSSAINEAVTAPSPTGTTSPTNIALATNTGLATGTTLPTGISEKKYCDLQHCTKNGKCKYILGNEKSNK